MTFEVHLKDGRYGQQKVLEDIQFSVSSGEVVGILGANGAGKTTAIRAILKTVDTGFRSLTLDGRDLSAFPTEKLVHNGIGYAPDGSWCFESCTVLDNLRFVHAVNRKYIRQKDPKKLLKDVFTIFPRLEERQGQLAGTMSGGERKMLAIGRVMMLDPTVMLLDEPSSGLAPIMVKELYRAIANIKKQGYAAIVLAEQNAEVCMKISDYCLVMDLGVVVARDTPQKLSENEEVRKAYFGI